MRTLLRNSLTGLYVESLDTWTNRADGAFAFDKMDQAIWFARQSDISGMELVFVSDAAGPVVRVPLGSLGRASNVTRSAAAAV